MLNYAAAPYTPASETGLAVPGDPVVPHHVSPSRKKFLASRKSPPESPSLELSPEIEALIDARIQQAQIETQKFIEARILQSQSEMFDTIGSRTIPLYLKNKKEIIVHQAWLEDVETAILRMKKQIKVLSKRIDTCTDW